jgi:hypothetical protein
VVSVPPRVVGARVGGVRGALSRARNQTVPAGAAAGVDHRGLTRVLRGRAGTRAGGFQQPRVPTASAPKGPRPPHPRGTLRRAGRVAAPWPRHCHAQREGHSHRCPPLPGETLPPRLKLPWFPPPLPCPPMLPPQVGGCHWRASHPLGHSLPRRQARPQALLLEAGHHQPEEVRPPQQESVCGPCISTEARPTW